MTTTLQLLKIVQVQDITMYLSNRGVRQIDVYRGYIKPLYGITERTFRRWIAMKAIEQLEKRGVDWEQEIQTGEGFIAKTRKYLEKIKQNKPGEIIEIAEFFKK